MSRERRARVHSDPRSARDGEALLLRDQGRRQASIQGIRREERRLVGTVGPEQGLTMTRWRGTGSSVSRFSIYWPTEKSALASKQKQYPTLVYIQEAKPQNRNRFECV